MRLRLSCRQEFLNDLYLGDITINPDHSLSLHPAAPPLLGALELLAAEMDKPQIYEMAFDRHSNGITLRQSQQDSMLQRLIALAERHDLYISPCHSSSFE